MITLNLRGSLSQWQIFSIRRTDDSLLPVQFADDSQFGTFVQNLKDLSLYDTDVDVTSDDTMLTLSTCDGSSRERFVIHAKKIN
jgi:sortase B